MADDRIPSDDRDDRSAGLDVWLPAAAAIAAAVFLIAAAHAETAPPRLIYDASRFDEATIAREAAEADMARAVATADAARAVANERRMAVQVVALPPIEAVPPVDMAREPAASPLPASPLVIQSGPPGWMRILLPLGIAALLAAALAGIARVWQHTEPSLA